MNIIPPCSVNTVLLVGGPSPTTFEAVTSTVYGIYGSID